MYKLDVKENAPMWDWLQVNMPAGFPPRYVDFMDADKTGFVEVSDHVWKVWTRCYEAGSVDNFDSIVYESANEDKWWWPM